MPSNPYTPDEARGVALGIREEGITREMWEAIAVTLEHYATESDGTRAQVEFLNGEITDLRGSRTALQQANTREVLKRRWAVANVIRLRKELKREAPVPFCPPHLGLLLKHPKEYAVGCIQCERNRLREELTRARAVLGSDCPKCGAYLNAAHWRSDSNYETERGFYNDETDKLCITVSDLLTNHPEIAKEMGLTE